MSYTVVFLLKTMKEKRFVQFKHGVQYNQVTTDVLSCIETYCDLL